MSETTHEHEDRVYGLVAEFTEPEPLLDAVKKARRAGYREMDAYTPFPVPGLGTALGMKSTGIPPLVLLGAIAGGAGGFGMQYYASVLHYPYDVGGMPFFSWPAFIPIAFEMMILVAGFACFGGLLALCGLPRPHHPIFNAKNFERASSDRFFLCIETRDRHYDAQATRAFLESLDPVEVSEVTE